MRLLICVLSVSWFGLAATLNDKYEIHPFIKKEFPPKPLEFDIPVEATKDKQLTLKWTRTPGLGDAGRGCQVSEVWLIRK